RLVLTDSSLHRARAGRDGRHIAATVGHPVNPDFLVNAEVNRLRCDLCVPMENHLVDLADGERFFLAVGPYHDEAFPSPGHECTLVHHVKRLSVRIDWE